MVAPFLATRIWNRNPFDVDLVTCQRCGFLFYNPRLEPHEEAKLYSGYRLEEYQKLRQSSEPRYTSKFNFDLASPASYDYRRKMVASIIAKHSAGKPIRRVLDQGGDRGDLVAGLIPGADAFLYEISGVTPVPGVTAIKRLADCNADLLINSNVLEHVGFPQNIVKEALEAAVPHGGLCFFEVPCENPPEHIRFSRALAHSILVSAYHPSLARFFLRSSALCIMHEHVNYFDEHSLVALIRTCGGNVLASGQYDHLAWCLTQRA